MGVLLQNDHPVGGISADVIEDINFDLTTNAKNLPGAINELNGKSSTTVSVTQAEYDALPSSKLTDDIAYYIKDGVPDVDNALWNKVGTTTLETTAKDCSGAINELNSSKTNLLTVDSYANEVGSVAANSIIDTTITVEKTGYTALGVIGFNINVGGGCGMVSCRLTGGGSTVSCRIRNNSSSASGSNTEVRVYVLFVKD